MVLNAKLTVVFIGSMTGTKKYMEALHLMAYQTHAD
jgi:hypothetical protein